MAFLDPSREKLLATDFRQGGRSIRFTQAAGK